MTPSFVRVEARIRFLSTEEGGRQSPLHGAGPYRPNHNFFGPDDRDMCIGSIELAEGEQVKPGDTILKVVSFLATQVVISEVREGREWRLQEGARLVAIGSILRLLD